MDYLGTYRNLGDQGERFHRLTNLVVGQPRPEVAKPESRHYQRNRRLSADNVARLVTGYESGSTVYDLGREFNIHRKTAAELLRRQGVVLTYRKLTDDQLVEAERLHADGWSFVRLGEHFGVNQSTVWNALKKRSTKLSRPSR